MSKEIIISIKVPDAHVELIEELNIPMETAVRYIKDCIDIMVLDGFNVDEFKDALLEHIEDNE